MGRKKTKDNADHRPPATISVALSTSLPELHPWHRRNDALGLAVLFTGILILYAVSTPRTVMLEDDGSFISASWFAGVAHPPGYPLYILLGWLVSHLIPFGSVAWRVHSLSGLMGALTCACIAWIIIRRTGNRPAAYLAAAALGVSEHFWSQAIIADVYTTNTAIVFLTLVLIQEAAVRRDTRLWVAAAGVYGLGFANHYPLLILGSPVFLAFVVAAGRDFRSRFPYLAPISVLAAATIYGWMVWRSHHSGPINFYGPLESWDRFVAFVDRSIYKDVDTNINAGFRDKLLYARYVVTEALLQFSVVGGLVALWGMFTSWRSGWRLGFLCELLALVGSSFMLIALLGFNYEYGKVAIFRPYPLVAYGIFALWLGYGVHALTQRARAGSGPVLPVMYAIGGLVVAAMGVWNGSSNYRPHDTFAEEQAQAMLDLAEENANLIVKTDGFVMPIAYLHWVEGRRKDLRVLEAHGLLFNDRIAPPWLIGQYIEKGHAAWAKFIREAEQPVYFLATGRPLVPELGYRVLGFIDKFDATVPLNQARANPSDRAKEYFKKLIAMPKPHHIHSVRHRNNLIREYGKYLGYVLVMDHPEANKYIEDVLPLAESDYWSLVGMAYILVQQQGEKWLRAAEPYLRKARRLAGDDRSKMQRAHLFYLEGLVEQRKGNAGKAKALFLESLNLDRAETNKARQALQRVTASGAG